MLPRLTFRQTRVAPLRLFHLGSAALHGRRTQGWVESCEGLLVVRLTGRPMGRPDRKETGGQRGRHILRRYVPAGKQLSACLREVTSGRPENFRAAAMFTCVSSELGRSSGMHDPITTRPYRNWLVSNAPCVALSTAVSSPKRYAPPGPKWPGAVAPPPTERESGSPKWRGDQK